MNTQNDNINLNPPAAETPVLTAPPAAGAAPLLSCVGLSKRFGHTAALDGATFELQRGRITGLLGPNGSGKTTLLKLACGLIAPSAGAILINGLAPGAASKRAVSYLPERSYLNDWMRVEQLVKFFADFYADFDSARAGEMLHNLGIEPKARLKTLSKGNQEKVQLILVMSRNAQLYLLDEPIGGVDPAAREYIIRTIIGNYQPESTVLLSTHIITDIEQALDDVIFLDHGRVTLQGSVDDIRAQHGRSVDSLFREVFRC
ncbi:MAG: ABC transporter ATP-binding protein [Bacillota bacterium]|nr:ABC transporter ATP-binding protein [Bacillota bacterium]